MIKVFKLYSKEKEVLNEEEFDKKLELLNPFSGKDGKEMTKRYNGYIYINFTKVLSIKNKKTKENINLEEIERFKGLDMFLRFRVNYAEVKGKITYYITPIKDILITKEKNFNDEENDVIDNFEFFENLLYIFSL